MSANVASRVVTFVVHAWSHAQAIGKAFEMFRNTAKPTERAFEVSPPTGLLNFTLAIFCMPPQAMPPFPCFAMWSELQVVGVDEDDVPGPLSALCVPRENITPLRILGSGAPCASRLLSAKLSIPVMNLRR